MNVAQSHSRPLFGQNLLPLLLIACLIIFSHFAVWHGQFTGEDEVMQLDYATRMIQDIRTLNLSDFFRALASQSHPPLRYWLSMPGVLLFPGSEFGLRLGAILLSFYMTYQVTKLGQEVGGTTVGIASGVLIAVSPVYNWTSMAFGWSVIVVAIVQCIRLLRSKSLDIRTLEGRRTYVTVNLLVIVAFLINTGNILFFISTCLVYFLFNRHQFFSLVKISVPFVLFFVLYYSVYLFVVPYVGATYFDITTPVGQFSQNLGRAGQSYLNYTSFIENLRGINAYFFPYVSWIFLACALYYLLRYEWVIALWISLFTLAWSFFLTNQSHQYFLLVFVAIFPFGVKVIYNLLGQRFFVAGVALLAILMALWNYQIYLRPYGSNDPTYPTALIALGNAHVSRVHNITEPFAKIGEDIDALLGEGETFVHDLAGSFTMYYYRSARYAGQFGSAAYPSEFDPTENCYRLGIGYADVRIVVTTKEICPSEVQERITYPDSKIRLFVLKPR